MAVQNPYAKMQQNSILTTPKEELTLMLYEGALKFCNQAIIAIEHAQIAKAHDLIMKVQDIIREFQMTIDKSYPISSQFLTMYEYIYRRLVEANLAKDVEILGECRDLIRDFRDTWKEAMLLAKTKPQTSQSK